MYIYVWLTPCICNRNVNEIRPICMSYRVLCICNRDINETRPTYIYHSVFYVYHHYSCFIYIGLVSCISLFINVGLFVCVQVKFHICSYHSV